MPLTAPTPLLLSTWSFGRWGHDLAWPALRAGGSALDAVEAAVRQAEADPRVDSVGLGGLPDARGEVTLDAAVMESPTRWGSVLCVRGRVHAVTLARRVMDRFGRGIRAAEGAELLADAEGLPTQDLLTDATRAWLAHRRKAHPAQHPTALPSPPVGILDLGGGELHLTAERKAAGLDPRDENRWVGHDTVGVLALDAQGRLAAATSTSGMPLKPVGRVGDSAIPGHGLACEPGVGAAVATGAGELISSTGACHDVLSSLRAGEAPGAAIARALARLDAATLPGTAPQVGLIALAPDGRWAAGALRPGFFVAVTSESGTRVEPVAGRLP